MADLNGLPAVDGLQDFIASDPDFAPQDKAPVTDGVPQDGQQAQAPQDGQAQADDLDWGQFKNPKDLLKSYKEIQGFTTKVSQENKALKDELQRLKEESELRQYIPQQPAMPQNPQSFEEMFINNPEQAITAKAAEIANVQRIREVLDEEASKNPNEFRERLAFAKMLANDQRFAPLAQSPKGVQKLFEIADKERRATVERQAHESLKVLFGEDYDMEKVKALVRKDPATAQGQTQTNNPQTINRNAYMPDFGTSTRTGADINVYKSNLQQIKEEAIKKGDPSAVAGALLREALLK